jgi:hypothetical protein
MENLLWKCIAVLVSLCAFGFWYLNKKDKFSHDDLIRIGERKAIVKERLKALETHKEELEKSKIEIDNELITSIHEEEESLKNELVQIEKQTKSPHQQGRLL